MLEIQDMVNIAANGTVASVKHSVSWVMDTVQQVIGQGCKMADDGVKQSLVGRAMSVASVGMDSALNKSEALMDQILPPTEDNTEKEAHMVQGFEAVTLSYPVRLVSLTAKLCRRTYHKIGPKVMERLPRPLVQHLQTSWPTLTWSLHGLPQYLQHQAVSVLFFLSQMYNLSCRTSKQNPHNGAQRSPNTAEASVAHSSVPHVHPQASPNYRMRKSPEMFPFDNRFNTKDH
ncbi:hypothetical protein LDENG_00112640 [Lucifuga dentata]|nr:hypothetical protein LDENG_00112640 [Lucifuga dentata]